MTQEAREHLFLVLFFDNKRTWSVLCSLNILNNIIATVECLFLSKYMNIQFKSKTKASGIHLSTHQKHFSSSKETKVHDDRRFTRNDANVVLESKKTEIKHGVVSDVGQSVQKQGFLVRKRQVLAIEYTRISVERACTCACACPGSGCPAPNWCLLVWTRSWTKRKCWRAGSPTSASRCRSPTTALCSTAARCRETPAARPATVTERSLLKQALTFRLSITKHKSLFQ